MGSQLRPRSAYNSNNFSGLSSVQWFTKLLLEVVLSYLMYMLYLKALFLVKHRRGSSNCAARRLLQAVYPMMGSLYSFMELYTKALVYRVFLRESKDVQLTELYNLTIHWKTTRNPAPALYELLQPTDYYASSMAFVTLVWLTSR